MTHVRGFFFYLCEESKYIYCYRKELVRRQETSGRRIQGQEQIFQAGIYPDIVSVHRNQLHRMVEGSEDKTKIKIL